MLELKILLDNIDYDSLADALVPLVAEKMREGEKSGILGGILAKTPATATAMTHMLLKTMPQEKRNDLLVQLAAKHRDKILEKGRELLGKNSVKMEICDFSVKEL